MSIKYVEEPLPAMEIIDFKIDSWYGINKNNANYRFGDLKDCRNMSAENFPYSSPRRPREVIKSGIINPQRIFSNDGSLGYIANGKFYYDDEEKGDCGNTSSIVVYDDKIYTFPSNSYYDAKKDSYNENASKIGQSQLGLTINDKEVAFYLSLDRIKNYAMMFKTGKIAVPQILDEQGESTGEFAENLSVGYSGISPDEVFIRFFYNGIPIANGKECSDEYQLDLPVYSDNLKVETITIDGVAKRANQFVLYFGYFHRKTGKVNNCDVDEDDIKRCKDDFNKMTKEDAKIWINGTTYPNAGGIPIINYACEYNNRVVGIQGSDIYASSLGDLSTWTDFENETGSFGTDVGTTGDFTGIVNYQGMIFMFKPDTVHQLYGNALPFYVRDGFKTGCIDGKSICEVNSTLYWLGREGVYEYSGGVPRVISNDIFEGYKNATSCTDGRMLYMCLNDGKKYETYVFDTQTRLWHKYDDTPYVDLTYCDGYVYGLTANGDIVRFDSGNERVVWSFETHDINFGIKNRKNVSKIWIRADMKPQTMLNVFVSSDGGGYKQVAHYVSTEETMFDFKIRIKKADSFSFRFEGVGEIKIIDVHAKVTVGTTKHRAGSKLDVFR